MRFEEWFRNSVVVQDDGSPLTVYHATTQSFSAFRTEHLGKNSKFPTAQFGIYFTSSPIIANWWVVSRRSGASWDKEFRYGNRLLEVGAVIDESHGAYKNGANIVPVVLAAKKPFVMDLNQYQTLAKSHSMAQNFRKRLPPEFDSIRVLGSEKNGFGDTLADQWIVFDSMNVRLDFCRNRPMACLPYPRTEARDWVAQHRPYLDEVVGFCNFVGRCVRR